ncbi:MAG: rhombosortase, partial [Rubrivivax sp.]|nr:rhombosortase [Rubrivivax sp.]
APTALWDWQPQRANSQPWRLFSAAFVHWSPLHLGANLIGTALVAALGWTARVPPALALAWLVAWPLTHLALLAQPTLMHYGGLSGLLHAGVAAVATWLLLRASGRPRWVGAALLAGLALKVGLEAPWAGPLMQAPGWDIAIAPLAHASGSAAGLLGALAVALASRRH